MVKYGIKVDGVDLNGLVYGVEASLESYPEIGLPKDVFRQDVYWDLFNRNTSYTKLVERDTGSLSVVINTMRPQGSILRGGRTEFETEFIHKLSQKVLIEVELEETPGLIYICTLASNITKENIGGRTRSFTYTLDFDIEWIERRVLSELMGTNKRYELQNSGRYYMVFEAVYMPVVINYMLGGTTQAEYEDGLSVSYGVCDLYDGGPKPRVDTYKVDTLAHTVTTGEIVVGFMADPVEFITGVNSVYVDVELPAITQIEIREVL